MANSNKPKGKTPANNRNKQKLPVYKKEAVSVSLLDGLNNWFAARAKGISIFIFVCGALFSLLMFQARMDIGGDDSTYLQRAYDFLHKGIFPSFQGPLYPIVLSFFVAPFGINIILLKFLSVIFNIVGLYFFYKAFKDRVPAVIFYPVFFICATNSYILSYASLTYSEAFFSCIQYIFFFFFFKLIDREGYGELSLIKKNYKPWLLAGFFLFALILTRNVGISSVGAIVAFFLINKQYRSTAYIIGALILFEIPVWLIEKIFFKAQNQWGSQGNTYLYKDPYDFSKGKETLSGFFTRFFQNCDIYISKRFFEIIGFRSEENISSYKPFESDGLSMFVVLLFIIAALVLYRIIKSKNKYMLLTFLYALCIMVTSFFALQIRWDQPRIIMVCVPVVMLSVFYALYEFVKKGSWAMQLILFIIIIIFTFADTGRMLSKTNKNLPVLSKNLHG
ncbi:MAG TPA: hypothetical protein VK783_05175, partial [Bacteroidia bacterium]|nr:hypothetical protein [Bacteroidia bacterium]